MIRYLPMYWETTLVDRVEVAFADAMKRRELSEL